MPAPKLPDRKTTERSYATLYAKAKRDHKVHAGRNLLRHGLASGRPASLAVLRKETTRLWRQFNKPLIVKYLGSQQYLYDVYNTRGVRDMVEVVFDRNGLDEGTRSMWRCIINNESGWVPNVWNGGLTGWQPKYIGTDKVVGLMQMRPYHADGVSPNQTVSYATYVKLSDPVYSIQKGLRLGPGPFFAQAGNCF